MKYSLLITFILFIIVLIEIISFSQIEKKRDWSV